jgi:hypothetical protein
VEQSDQPAQPRQATTQANWPVPVSILVLEATTHHPQARLVVRCAALRCHVNPPARICTIHVAAAFDRAAASRSQVLHAAGGENSNQVVALPVIFRLSAASYPSEVCLSATVVVVLLVTFLLSIASPDQRVDSTSYARFCGIASPHPLHLYS